MRKFIFGFAVAILAAVMVLFPPRVRTAEFFGASEAMNAQLSRRHYGLQPRYRWIGTPHWMRFREGDTVVSCQGKKWLMTGETEVFAPGILALQVALLAIGARALSLRLKRGGNHTPGPVSGPAIHASQVLAGGAE